MDDADFQRRAARGRPRRRAPSGKALVGPLALRRRRLRRRRDVRPARSGAREVDRDSCRQSRSTTWRPCRRCSTEIIEGLGRRQHEPDGRARAVVIEKPFGRDLQSGAGPRRRACTRSSTSRRSTGSITTSGRRRSRTSWPCGSPTRSSSRSGTAAMSTTCRSPSPRTIGVEHRGELLREGRRAARHRPEPRAAGAGAHCDGAARHHRRQGIRDEKVKALRSVADHRRPSRSRPSVVRAQYARATRSEGGRRPGQSGRDVRGHAPRTSTTGAGPACPSTSAPASDLPQRATEVVLAVPRRPPPAVRVQPSQRAGPEPARPAHPARRGITLRFGAKVPGQEFNVRSVSMDFTYSEAFSEEPPDAYERLLLDVMVGDPTLFIRSDEVDAGVADRAAHPRCVGTRRHADHPLSARNVGAAGGQPHPRRQPGPLARPPD